MSMSEILPSMRALTARLLPRRGALRFAAGRPLPARAPSRPDKTAEIRAPQISIPVPEQTRDATECRRHQAQGRFLARQEDWGELGRLIRDFDRQRALTPGGTSVARLFAEGARADAVSSARLALAEGDPRRAKEPLAALDALLDETGPDHGVAYVIAMAHIDAAWAWHGPRRWDGSAPAPERQAGFDLHMAAALRLIDGFDAFECDAPTLAAARCALLPFDADPPARVADDYEDLIDLDPACADHMRAFGRALLPRAFGDYEALELQARRTAARTADLWGTGGYAWVYWDALALDRHAFRHLDAELFVEGLHDILDRHPGQHMVNMAAALTGYTLAGDGDGAGIPAHRRVRGCFDWLVQDRLREVHPLVWADAFDPGHDRRRRGPARIRLQTGRARALSALAEHFAAPIKDGRHVTFTETGIEIA